MAHWTDAYIGLPYIEGENDCAAFTARVQREVFGREIRLPSERAAGVRGWSAQIEAHRDDVARPTHSPVEGDAVLMIGRGRLCHIGTFVPIHGALWVIHAMRSAGQVVMHRIHALPRVGLEVEGYYRWL